MYSDITNTIDNSNILIDVVAKGRVLDFYEMTAERSVTNYAANYSFIIYVVFALWQAPVYLICHMTGLTYMKWPLAMLWSKLLVVLFSAAAACFVYKIVLLCTENMKRSILAVCLYYSSFFVFYPVFICGQLDVFSMTFMLCGLYQYMQGHMKGFWLSFLIAVPFKMFAILLALPLILAKQKSLLKAGVTWISMAALILIENLLFYHSPLHYYALKAQSDDAIGNLLRAHITVGRPFSLFLAVYIIIVIWAWLKELSDNKSVIHISFLIWGAFICFTPINSYWIFLVAPFMIMSICVSDRYLPEMIFLGTLAEAFYFLNIVARGAKAFMTASCSAACSCLG